MIISYLDLCICMYRIFSYVFVQMRKIQIIITVGHFTIRHPIQLATSVSTPVSSGGNQMPLCCKAITPLRRCSPCSNNQTPWGFPVPQKKVMNRCPEKIAGNYNYLNPQNDRGLQLQKLKTTMTLTQTVRMVGNWAPQKGKAGNLHVKMWGKNASKRYSLISWMDPPV